MARLVVELRMSGSAGVIHCPSDERLQGTVAQYGGWWMAGSRSPLGHHTFAKASAARAVARFAARFGYSDVYIKIRKEL